MSDNQNLVSEILDLLLPFSVLTPTAIVAYFHLYRLRDDEGNGYVRYVDMSMDFGVGKRRCRDCVTSLRRCGLIEGMLRHH